MNGGNKSQLITPLTSTLDATVIYTTKPQNTLFTLNSRAPLRKRS